MLGSAQKKVSNVGSDFGTLGTNFPGHFLGLAPNLPWASANFPGDIAHRLLGSAWNIASNIGSLFGPSVSIFWAILRGGVPNLPSDKGKNWRGYR